jgi:23S rRNA (guanosine2251-2'-O)-methyltransferase
MHAYGINTVIESLRADRVAVIRVSRRNDERIREIVALAAEHRVPVRRVSDDDLNRVAPGGAHQGVVADLKPARSYDVADLVREAVPPALLVVLDGVEDPQNFGAILRSVDAAGAHGVIRQTRRAAPLGGAASKASAGAAAHVKVADVVNIARAVEELKKLGVWTVGLAGDAPASYDQVDLTLPVALVMGAEGSGLRRLVRERCDFLVKIPMAGHVGSLNVSVAAGIALFEAVRQRKVARS